MLLRLSILPILLAAVALCYKGLDNYHLRSFANGRYLNIFFARSIKEGVFTQTLLTATHESKLDLDQIAANFCQKHNIHIADRSRTEANLKKLQTQALAEWVNQQLKQFHQPGDVATSASASSLEGKRKTAQQQHQSTYAEARAHTPNQRCPSTHQLTTNRLSFPKHITLQPTCQQNTCLKRTVNNHLIICVAIALAE